VARYFHDALLIVQDEPSARRFPCWHPKWRVPHGEELEREAGAFWSLSLAQGTRPNA